MSNLLKGGQFLTLPAATFCPPKGEMLTRTTTGCAVKQRVIRGYIRECLQWMIDDGVVSRIDLDIRRTGINELGNSINLWRRDGPVMISFDDLWSAITHGGQ